MEQEFESYLAEIMAKLDDRSGGLQAQDALVKEYIKESFTRLKAAETENQVLKQKLQECQK